MVTPNLPEATCLIADRIDVPSGIILNLSTSSPPSPVLDFPPILFIANAKLVWASLEMEPNDIAPVANLFTMSAAGSIFSRDILCLFSTNSNKPLGFRICFD